MLRAAAAHQGAALVEIYQNCPVFNDGAFDALRDKKAGAINAIRLEHGQPVTFNGGTQQVVRDAATGDLRIADAGDGEPIVHDAHRDDPSLAFALSRLALVAQRADADRHLPLRRRPVSGQELTRSWPANRARRRQRRARRAVARRRHLDRRLSGARASRRVHVGIRGNADCCCAGRRADASRRDVGRVDRKADASPVTAADRKVEAALRARLAVERPGDGVAGGGGRRRRSAAGRRWLLDPIDGTVHFARGVPLWATLIGLSGGRRGRGRHGQRARARRAAGGACAASPSAWRVSRRGRVRRRRVLRLAAVGGGRRARARVDALARSAAGIPAATSPSSGR